MFERYTEKARRVIFFARFEASQFGSPYIETEHMLLGLLREDKPLASRFLGPSGAESIRREVEGGSERREKISTSVDLPLSQECKRILAFGADEAGQLGHKHIETAHLLIGILREEEGKAARLLNQQGVQLAAVREELQRPQAKAPAVRRKIGPLVFARFSEQATRAVCFAIEEAMEVGSQTVEIGHLLLGVLREDQTDAAVLEAVRRRVEEHVAMPGSLVLSRDCEGALAFASHEAERLGSAQVETGHLLLGILYEEDSLAAEILKERGVSRSGILERLEEGLG